MNCTLDIHFKKETRPHVSEFSWQRAKNWLHLWVRDAYIDSYPLTYTVEEALEIFCETHNQIFKGVSCMAGVRGWKHGTYLWERP